MDDQNKIVELTEEKCDVSTKQRWMKLHQNWKME